MEWLGQPSLLAREDTGGWSSGVPSQEPDPRVRRWEQDLRLWGLELLLGLGHGRVQRRGYTADAWTVTVGDAWTVTAGGSWKVTAGDPWTVTAGAPGRSQLALEESEARSLPGLGPAGSRVAPGLLLSVSLREDNPGDQAPGRGLLSCHPEARRAVRLSKQTEEGSADGSAGGDWRPEQAPRVLFRPVFCGPA